VRAKRGRTMTQLTSRDARSANKKQAPPGAGAGSLLMGDHRIKRALKLMLKPGDFIIVLPPQPAAQPQQLLWSITHSIADSAQKAGGIFNCERLAQEIKSLRIALHVDHPSAKGCPFRERACHAALLIDDLLKMAARREPGPGQVTLRAKGIALPIARSIGDIRTQSISEMRAGPRFQAMIDAFVKDDLSGFPLCAKCDIPCGILHGEYNEPEA